MKRGWKERFTDLFELPWHVAVWRVLSWPFRRLRTQADRIRYMKPILRFWELLRLAPRNHRIAEKGLNLLPPFSKAWMEKLHAAYPRECGDALMEAERVLNHNFYLLGIRFHAGDPIAWDTDFRSDYTWDTTRFFRDITIEMDRGWDVKVPWELCRFQHISFLGQAFWMTGEARYAREMETQILAWIRAHPVARGIHWMNPMELAIRSLNWIVGWEFLKKGGWKSERAFIRRLFQSLVHHGSFIRSHLEYSPELTSNHYIADLVGLFALGTVLEGWPQAAAWRGFAASELERELEKQVRSDGFHGEASTLYHSLVLEGFLLCYQIGLRHGFRFSEAFVGRLEKMLSFLGAALREDGTCPQIGDTDNGRFLSFLPRPPLQRGFLLDWGRQLPALANSTAEPDYEALWYGGIEKIPANHASIDKAPARKSTASGVVFRDGGIGVIRNGPLHLIFRAGDTGQRGRGGHAHNDALGIDLSLGAIPLIVDPGTGSYTKDLAERNRFRATSLHSTVVVDGAEINPIPAEPFLLPDQAQARIVHWEQGDGWALIAGTHRGYFRLQQPVLVCRSIFSDTQEGFFFMKDLALGTGTHRIEQRFHLHPEAVAESDGTKVVLRVAEGRKGLLLAPLNTGGLLLSKEPALYSPGYGEVVPSSILIYTREGRTPLTFELLIAPWDGAPPSGRALDRLLDRARQARQYNPA